MKSIDYARKAKEAINTPSQEHLCALLKSLVLAGVAVFFLRFFYAEYQYIIEVLFVFLISNLMISRYRLGKKLEFYGNLNDAYESTGLEQIKVLHEMAYRSETTV